VMESERRRAICLRLGVALTALFLILRWIDVYGDPRHWRDAPSPLFFIATTKYPASLLFLLMTLGPMFLLLALAERWQPNILSTFGRVPMFYYLLHIPLIHALALIAWLLRDGAAQPERFATAPYVSIPPGQRWGLGLLYVVWILAVAILYPLCRWYARVKAERPDSWLRFV